MQNCKTLLNRLVFLLVVAFAGNLPANTVSDSATVVLAPVDSFSGPLDAWFKASGGNVQIGLSVATNAAARKLDIAFTRKDPADDSAANNYFHIRRMLSAVPAAFDGIRVTLSAAESQSVYLDVGVLGGQWWKPYGSGPLQPAKLGPEPTTFYIPLGHLKSGGAPFNPAQERIIGIALSGRAPLGLVRMHELSFCRKVSFAGWVTASASVENPSTIFERGAPVAFNLKVGTRPTPQIDGLVYAVTDDLGNSVATGTVALGTGSDLALRLPALPTGYYELRLLPAQGGKAIAEESCLKSAGTAPAGCLPFAVMPATIQENIDRIRRVGEDDAFFGIHNLRFQYKLHELMAFPWCLRPVRWNDYEAAAKPERPSGAPAAWVAKQAAREPVMPDYLFAFTGFNPNHVQQIPAWALTAPGETPGFRWEDFGPYARDQVGATARLYPHQKRRLIEGAWEINLNFPPYEQKPFYDHAQVVDLFRNLRPIVKAADPNALFLGPTTSPSAEFIGRLCDLGFLDIVDGISLHCYAEPESLIAQLAALRRTLSEHGKPDLPLYDSECGFMSTVGGVQRLREQAAKLVRQNLVLKGEGVVAHLTFYPFDYGRDGEGTYGICFSLDDRLGFGPAALAPKPAVPALAVCANELLGAKPIWRIQGWGDDLYGYSFLRNGGEPVLALWTTGPARTLRLPVGDAASARVTEFMGKVETRPAVNGMIEVEISDAPVYVAGMMPELYATPPVGDVLRVYPGQDVVVDLPAGFETCKAWGIKTSVDPSARRISLGVPSDRLAGPVPILLFSKEGSASGVQWLAVQSPVEVIGYEPVQQGSRLDLLLHLVNHSNASVKTEVQTSITGSGQWHKQSVTLAPGARSDVRAGLSEQAKPLNPRDVLPVSVNIVLNDADRFRADKRLTFLCAQSMGAADPLPPPYADQVQLEGLGSSGVSDSADFRFAWDAKKLVFGIVRKDDVQCQPHADGDMWRGDSIQLAFDTEPDSDRLYNPMTSMLTKKVTEVTVSKTTSGCGVWRHATHNKNELPLGRASGWDVTWDRDDRTQTTRIAIEIPWSEIGMTTAPGPGQQIGIAALVNDLDGEALPRKTLKLFDGIDSATKSYKEFGRITLD